MTIGGDDHRLQTQVQPDHFRRDGQGCDVFFDQDGDKVATCTILRDRHGRRLAPIRQGTRPHDVQGHIHLCQGERRSVPPDGRAYVGCRLRAMLLFERWVTGVPFEEVDEGSIQVAQDLLLGNRGDVVQPQHSQTSEPKPVVARRLGSTYTDTHVSVSCSTP
jgi:hypothetical protein